MSGNGRVTIPKLREYGHGPDSRLIQELTERQMQVLRLLVEGLENKAIGLALGLHPGTVRTHLDKIFKRLEVHTRGQAIHVAYKSGILERPQTEKPQTVQAAFRLARYYLDLAERLAKKEQGE